MGASPATPARRLAVGGSEQRHVPSGCGKELRTEQGAESGEAQDDLGVSVLAEPPLDKGVDLGDFLVESDHRLRQPYDHVGGEPLAGQGRVLRRGGLDRDCRDGSGVADFPVAHTFPGGTARFGAARQEFGNR
ncbi:hypothetical protein GCM10027445_21310 [Amycolatopsis endophytica]